MNAYPYPPAHPDDPRQDYYANEDVQPATPEHMEADLVALTQQAGEDSIAIAALKSEIARLRATLSYIEDILAQQPDSDTVRRVRIFICCALNEGEVRRA